jgi:hypothetical protein
MANENIPISGGYCHNGERIAELEKQVALLDHELSDIRQNQNIVLEQQATLIARITYTVWGHNGETGLAMDVDRLKQVNIADRLKSLESTINRWAGALSLATIAVPLLIKFLWP